MSDYPLIVILSEKYYKNEKLAINGQPLSETLDKHERPYVAGTIYSSKNNTYFIPFRSKIPKAVQGFSNGCLMLPSNKKPEAGLDLTKMLIIDNGVQLEVNKFGIPNVQFEELLKNMKTLKKRIKKYVSEYQREVRTGEKLRPEYRYTSLRNFHKELGLEKMEQQTERELDLENLKQLQEDGKIDEGVNIKHVADQLPAWRESDERSDKELLAKYGRGSDLDKLVNDDDINVVIAVADRGRDKDLDKLVGYEDEEVRAVVAEQGRDKDLDRLVDDTSTYVRERVATVGRDKDLDQLVDDPELGVRYYVAKQGRDKDLDILVNDEEEDVRVAVAEMGRDKDLGKLVNDKDPDVRKAAEDALEKNRGRSSDLEKRRRAAARQDMER